MKKKLSFLEIIVACFLILAGCGKQEIEKYDGTFIEFVSTDETRTVKVPYKFVDGSPEQQITDLLLKLHTEQTDSEYKRTLPADVEVTGWDLRDGTLYISFDADYYSMSRTREILVRAAVVRTLIQVEGVDNVQFLVAGGTLLDSSSTVVGLMNENTFLENVGEEIATLEENRLTLYFASADGQALVSEQRKVYYDSNTTQEQVIVENLLLGPDVDDAKSVFPQGTRAIDVTTNAGICYVNLSADFLNQNYDILETVTIYSIVDSLTELDSVQKVQIYINGETKDVYRDAVDISAPLERDMSYIATPESKEVLTLQE